MRVKKFFIILAIFMAVLTLIACQSTAKRTTSSTSSSIQKGKITKNPKSDKETGSNSQKDSKNSQTSASSTTIPESNAATALDEVMNSLPQDAQSAKTDKIYATGNAKVYYRSFGEGSSAQTPDFKGYTEEKVREILGAPEAVIRDSNYIKETFKRQELENLKALYQSQYVTEEQARAFYVVAADIAQAVGLGQDYQLDSDYILYSYKQNKVYLIFFEGELKYITPHPDYLYFK
ncbi:DUF4947 domain-containing protein [Streptococcus sinensis]|uniref:Lipoprotein n=1 Tax=Streptococcus sinensis TaxID=176090 RepID=A0A0A0DF84_9STRE|nr:DUF4947 domain-containing protein [Streptococcus sinensis]KGM36533.1 hypothetical protein SSIN_1746 [Streptococcus sinensis]